MEERPGLVLIGMHQGVERDEAENSGAGKARKSSYFSHDDHFCLWRMSEELFKCLVIYKVWGELIF